MLTRRFLTMIAAVFLLVIDTATAPLVATAAGMNTKTSIPVQAENADRDKTGTRGGLKNKAGSQVAILKGLASRVSFQAEGMGLEPTTGFPAPHFQ